MLPLKTIVEGLLFVADGPLGLTKIKEVFDNEISEERLTEVLEELTAEYDKLERAFIIKLVAGGYQFRSRPELASYATKLKKRGPSRLSKAALETLAVIAYRQPILRAEVEKIRGVDTGGVIRSLMEKDLIHIASRRENLPGRPMLYGTTPKFLETFDLPDISALPTIDEMEKLVPPEAPKLF